MPYPSTPPSAPLLSRSMTKRAPLVTRETGFYRGDVGTCRKGQGCFVFAVMKNSLHACLIGRVMVLNLAPKVVYQADNKNFEGIHNHCRFAGYRLPSQYCCTQLTDTEPNQEQYTRACLLEERCILVQTHTLSLSHTRTHTQA